MLTSVLHNNKGHYSFYTKLFMLALITALVDEIKFWSDRTSGADPQTRTLSVSYSPGKAPYYHQRPLKDRKYQ